MDRKAVLALMLALLLISMLTLAFNNKPVKSDWTWGETIYIRADGSIDPPTAPISSVDNVTYTLTGNFSTTAAQNGDGIVIERNNMTLDGAGHTVHGTGIRDCKGIVLSETINVTIRNMKIRLFWRGVYFSDSSFNSISGNSIAGCMDYGIALYSSSFNSISENNITCSYRGGILVSYLSNNNTICGNNITRSNYPGISLVYSSNNNSVFGNFIANNRAGIELWYSSGNILSENNIVANTHNGISLYGFSNNNTVSKNNVTNNEFGIWVAESSGNTISHNNFINNTNQTYSGAYCVNAWDNGAEGNYWSDHTFEDQNGDGICDEPYVIDDNNQDKYPLMSPWVTPEAVTFSSPFWIQWWFWTIMVAGIIALAGAVYFLKKRKPPTPITPTPPTESIKTSIE